MTYDDHADCDNQLSEAKEEIIKLKAELKKKDELLFAYESVHAPINPLLAENKRLRDRINELIRLGNGYLEITSELLKEQLVNVELGYEVTKKRDIFEQALKGAQ